MPYSSDYLTATVITPILRNEVASKILKKCASDMQFTRASRSPVSITSAGTPNYDNIIDHRDVKLNQLIDTIKTNAGSHVVVYANSTIIMKAIAHKDTAGKYAYKVTVNYQDGLDFYDIDTYYISLFDMVNALAECVEYRNNSDLIAEDGLNVIIVETEYTGSDYPLETYVIERNPTPYVDNGHSQSYAPKPGSNCRGD